MYLYFPDTPRSTKYGVPRLKSSSVHLQDHLLTSQQSFSSWVVDIYLVKKSLYSNHCVNKIQTLYLIQRQLTYSQSSHSISLPSILILRDVVKWTNSQLYHFCPNSITHRKEHTPLFSDFHIYIYIYIYIYIKLVHSLLNTLSSSAYPSVFWLVGSFPSGIVASHSFHCCITVSSCVSGDLL